MNRLSFLVLFLPSLLLANNIDHKDLWDGKEYNKHHKKQEEVAFATISDIQLNGHESILDIGCGNGNITELLSKKVPFGQVLGFDLSSSMISFAQDHFQNNNLSFMQGDARELKFNQEFDLIVSFATLQWIPEQKLALEGIYRALKPNGRVVIKMPQGLPQEMQNAVNEVTSKKKWASYFLSFSPKWRFFEKDEYLDLLKDVRLTTTSLESKSIEHVFPSEKAFFLFIKQFFPYLSALPENLKDPFLEEVIQCYLLHKPIGTNSEVYFNVRWLTATAVK